MLQNAWVAKGGVYLYNKTVMLIFYIPRFRIPSLISLSIALIHVVFIVFVLFFERKESRRRLVWLLVLCFLPGLGIIAYILLSGHIFTATRRMTKINLTADQFSAPLREQQIRSLYKNKDSIPAHMADQIMPLMQMNMTAGKSLLSYADSTRIFCYGREFFDDLCAELQKARSTINMEYFIFHSDKIGTKIMDILCEKARQGVEVKLMYDDCGSISTRTRFFRRLNSAGGKARPFFQIRIGLPLTLNYRNHRKVTIIDSKVAFIGGMNIGDEYANQNPKRNLNWRDTSIKLTGSCVFDLQTQFLSDWYSQDAWTNRAKKMEAMLRYFPRSFVQSLANAQEAQKDENFIPDVFRKDRIPTQLVTNDPHFNKKANIEDAFIRMIMSAKKRIYIETPYFTPDEEFYSALKIASYSGVKISIVIPGFWDKFYMKAASSEFARQMCGDGVQFYIYPGFIHSKMICVDGKMSSIGTTNIDIRSFSLHFEENVLFYDERFANRCERIVERDMKISMLVNKAYYDKKPMAYRAFCSFCKLFSPLL